jgi:hypothetical protein
MPTPFSIDTLGDDDPEALLVFENVRNIIRPDEHPIA